MNRILSTLGANSSIKVLRLNFVDKRNHG